MTRLEYVASFLASMVNDYSLDSDFEADLFLEEAQELLDVMGQYPEQLRMEVA